MANINTILGTTLACFYNGLHDKYVARKFWLSYVQGIHTWGLFDSQPLAGMDEPLKFDGTSGNQLLAIQVVDAFLGVEQYLPSRDFQGVVPRRQRAIYEAVQRHSFRHRLDELGDGRSEAETTIRSNFSEMVKQMRVRSPVTQAQVLIFLH